MLLDLLEGIYFSLFTQMGCYTPFAIHSHIMYVTLELISFNNSNLIGLDLPTNGQPSWPNSNNDFGARTVTFSFIMKAYKIQPLKYLKKLSLSLSLK